jgi:2-deoxy-D-gluconate 3-dehydrogenase
MFDLSGKVAMVTGGNGGIGLGIARGLAEAGANIVVAARNQPKTQDAVGLLEALGVEALGLSIDVADEGSVAAAVSEALDHFGRIDVLVNNAGISIRKSPQEYSVDEWDHILGVNLKGTFLCSREVHPHMAGNEGGAIINIGSMMSIFGSDWSAPYSASKGGVVQFTKSMAVAWARDRIRVNAILPGWIYTELTAGIETDYEERYALINQRLPAGRWGQPDDLAGAAVFLASPASNYVTGAIMPVDGGYSSF